jgi:hypothetical protein
VFVLKLVNKTKYEQGTLILPSALIVILWSILIAVAIVLLNKIFNINIFTVLFNSMLHINNSTSSTITVLCSFIALFIFGIVLQSFVILTINTDYNKIHYYLKKMLRLKTKENLNDNEIIENRKEKIKYITCFTSSLFIFSLFFFFFVLLYVIGILISSKLI